jgi:hypothetical protein
MAERPPLGLTPQRIWLELRIQEIEGAFQRYIEARKAIPVAWIVEYNEHLQKLF